MWHSPVQDGREAVEFFVVVVLVIEKIEGET
jgi:hypothetical protein